MSGGDRKIRLRPAPNESGQGILEYILILSFALTTSLIIARVMSAGMDRGILVFGGQLEKDLKTGRTPVERGWKN